MEEGRRIASYSVWCLGHAESEDNRRISSFSTARRIAFDSNLPAFDSNLPAFDFNLPAFDSNLPAFDSIIVALDSADTTFDAISDEVCDVDMGMKNCKQLVWKRGVLVTGQKGNRAANGSLLVEWALRNPSQKFFRFLRAVCGGSVVWRRRGTGCGGQVPKGDGELRVGAGQDRRNVRRGHGRSGSRQSS